MSAIKVPGWFWAIAIVCLVWNLLGVLAYIMQVTMSPEALAALPADQQALYANTPAWATGAFALAVFGGALGCAALLLRKRWAIALFVISLLGVLTQMVHSFFMSKNFDVFGPGAMIMPIMVIVIAVFLLWFSVRSKTKGWLI